MASTQALETPIAQETPQAQQLDLDNLPAGVDPIAAAIAAEMSPEEEAELRADFGAESAQEPGAPASEPAPTPDEVVANLVPQAPQAPAQTQAPATDPALLQLLQAQQAQLQALQQALVAQQVASQPKPDPLQELAKKLPEKYRGDPELLNFVQAITSLMPQGDASVRQELADLKQAMFAQSFADRNARAVQAQVLQGTLAGQADQSLAEELQELNFAVAAVNKVHPEQASAKMQGLVDRIGQAYVRAKGLQAKATAQAVKAAPKAVSANLSATQVPQDNLEITPEDVRAAKGNPVSAVFAKARKAFR